MRPTIQDYILSCCAEGVKREEAAKKELLLKQSMCEQGTNMKPMGRKKLRFPGKTDHHVKKYGLLNWWENIIEPSKGRERQKAKSKIDRELKDY